MHQVINVNSHSLPGPFKKIRAKYTGKFFPEISAFSAGFRYFDKFPPLFWTGFGA